MVGKREQSSSAQKSPKTGRLAKRGASTPGVRDPVDVSKGKVPRAARATKGTVRRDVVDTPVVPSRTLIIPDEMSSSSAPSTSRTGGGVAPIVAALRCDVDGYAPTNEPIVTTTETLALGHNRDVRSHSMIVRFEQLPNFREDVSMKAYLAKFDRLLALNRSPDSERLALLYAKVPDNISNFIDEITSGKEDGITWATVKEALIREYEPKSDAVSRIGMLMARKQGDCETPRSYVDALLELKRKADVTLEDSTMVTYAFNGLNEVYKNAMFKFRRSIKNMADFKEKLFEVKEDFDFEQSMKANMQPNIGLACMNTFVKNEVAPTNQRVDEPSKVAKKSDLRSETDDPPTLQECLRELYALRKSKREYDERVQKRAEKESQGNSPGATTSFPWRGGRGGWRGRGRGQKWQGPHHKFPAKQAIGNSLNAECSSATIGANKRNFRDVRCYQCGELGHIMRNCAQTMQVANCKQESGYGQFENCTVFLGYPGHQVKREPKSEPANAESADVHNDRADEPRQSTQSAETKNH